MPLHLRAQIDRFDNERNPNHDRTDHRQHPDGLSRDGSLGAALPEFKLGFDAERESLESMADLLSS
jgi:hypothetical protein